MWRSLAVNDVKSIRRDSLLVYVLFMPFLIVIMLRVLMPVADRFFAEQYGIDVNEYTALILSFFFVLQVPLIFGLVFGFLILDERDENTLLALRVTPLSMKVYMSYRMGSIFLFTLFYILLLLPFTRVYRIELFIDTLLIVLLSGLFSLFVLLFLATFASNKVEGLALMKGLGILFLGPIASYFITSNWQYMFGILPTYWPVKAFWEMWDGESYWFSLLIGGIYFTFLNWVMFKRFIKKTIA
ncbi:hypothetical protein [Bacillus solimangrovi]|uniref:Uncharacterized protein n=1 Tax=Bacillus solimangrovi TaxID=1305675 RepID=A0A1E5LK00_9BACI|nr:hypothetical protein [Bacillus solimangrovi]OEH94348.1 hypothetical protein BFG57_08820 [Bacillus solimangrovi]